MTTHTPDTPHTSIGARTVSELLDAVAARQPTPGGGAIAALTVAMSASLGEMVLRYRIGKAHGATHDALHGEALESLGGLRSTALALADTDARAFERLSALWKLPADDARRRAGWADAVAGAIDAPQQTMATGLAVLELLDRVSPTVGTNLRSDLAIAALLARSGVEAAAWNVRVNLPQLADEAQATDIEQETSRTVVAAEALRDVIERTCRGS